MNEHEKTNYRGAQAIIGRLSGKKIAIPNVNVPPMPSVAPTGVIHNGEKAEDFGEIDSSGVYLDVLCFISKFGLMIPETIICFELELWSIIL